MLGMVFRIIGGTVIATVGSLLVIKTERIIEQVGTNSWAESKFGSYGGTRFMWKMIGLFAVFIGFVVMTNMTEGFLMATVGKLLIPKQPL
ncbi:hypothetical protein JW899_03280 [Candidatus Uhrbacteria bacterium]|nr:hypothetical protein [Candidatus Uhrbacteria bacterium]